MQPNYNFYGGYPNYQPNYQQNYQQNANYQQQNQVQQQPKIGFDMVNGIEDAKAYIVGANQTFFLKDRNSDMMFIKRADANCMYSIEHFKLVKMNQEDDYARKSDLDIIKGEINKLFALIGQTGQVNEVKNEQ